MPRGAGEVADVFRRYGGAYRQQHGCSLSTARDESVTNCGSRGRGMRTLGPSPWVPLSRKESRVR
jgi:hypothetical protein